MKSLARLLSATLLATIALFVTGSVTAAEDVATQQELAGVKTSNQVLSAIWKRQPDSYTLQIVLDRSRYSARSGAAASAQPQAAAVSSSSAADGSSYFIGNAIANLRGLDPWIACGRTLTLIDGRRVVQGRPTPAPPPVPPPGSLIGKERRVEVWLLRADGTYIPPANYSCVDASRTSPGNPEISISYGYSTADTAQAVAAAVRIDNEYFIEKLQPLMPAPAAQ
jgi:hypothetical protein